MVKEALIMLALYMYFNGTGNWGGETTYLHLLVILTVQDNAC